MKYRSHIDHFIGYVNNYYGIFHFELLIKLYQLLEFSQ